MSVVYIKEQYSYIQLCGETIRVTKGERVLLEYPIHNIDNIVIIGLVQITTQAVNKLLKMGIDISYFSYNGKYLGHTLSENSKNVFLRLAQYECYNDVNRRIQYARAIVGNKIENQINMIRRYSRNNPKSEYRFLQDVKEIKNLKKV